MLGPFSKYSFFDIHILLNDDRDASTDPPIHVEYKRSGGAAILILVSLGKRGCLRTSFSSLSPNPAKKNKLIL
jgi:hypothetical protein